MAPTMKELIERQERANAMADHITYEEYLARNAGRLTHYLANKAAIDARIAREEAELDDDDVESE